MEVFLVRLEEDAVGGWCCWKLLEVAVVEGCCWEFGCWRLLLEVVVVVGCWLVCVGEV